MNSDFSQNNAPKGHNRKLLMIRTGKLIYMLVSILFFFAYYNFIILHYGDAHQLAHPETIIIFIAIYILFLIWFIRVYNGFNFGFSSSGDLIFSLTLATGFTNFCAHLIICIYLNRLVGIGYLLILCALNALYNTIHVFLSQKIFFHNIKAQETIIIYRNQSDLNKLREVLIFPRLFHVIGYIENPLSSQELFPRLQNCDVVFVAGVEPCIRNGISKFCLQNNIKAYIEPKIGDVIMMGSRHINTFSVPVLQVGRASPAFEYLLAKRISDILISLAAIIVLSPIMLLSAALIKLYDRGPALYRQLRLTKDGREFKILKFRSMRVDAESDGVARLASENDSRITPIGRILRACRMDELPQLFNVLKGDMSIVGPRPERPEIAKQYQEQISSFDLRLQVKAGITGYAQVYGKYNTEPYDKLQMDLMYINSMSIINDLWLMFATFKVLFQKDSSSGVEDNQITAVKARDDEDLKP